MEIEWKIGEIRQVKGEWCQCVEGLCCKDCAYHNEVYDLCDTESQECLSHKRSDGKDVIFKKLEKVGNPFLVIVGGLNILYQRYSLPFASKVTLEGPWYRTIDKFIYIEIEENKEDKQNMVEKLKEYFAQASKEQLEKDLELLKRFNESGLSVDGFIKENEQKKNLKPFDIKKAKEGYPVYTRDGRKARIVCFDRIDARPILALVPSTDGKGEDVFDYFVSGKRIANALESNLDLMIFPENP